MEVCLEIRLLAMKTISQGGQAIHIRRWIAKIRRHAVRVVEYASYFEHEFIVHIYIDIIYELDQYF